eukprot:TRINITY_DN1322_c2_g1_i1.p1 TRINITY_DN1322_c2_g1~~TRINITY_DN1322_c2_g1_i1.p1  ORF type:complete len:234 (-),score=103.61 TRINITY_DN1322_c2_g1_i1:57-758(-)
MANKINSPIRVANQSSNRLYPIYVISILGASSVGKTSLIEKLTNNSNIQTIIATTSIDIKSFDVNIHPNTIIRLEFKDTVGMERFASLTTSIFRCHGSIFVYDVTNQNSLDSLIPLIDCVYSISPNPVSLIIGNKIDLSSKVVSLKNAQDKFSNRKNVTFCEMSILNSSFNEINELILNFARQLHSIHGLMINVDNRVNIDGNTNNNNNPNNFNTHNNNNEYVNENNSGDCSC